MNFTQLKKSVGIRVKLRPAACSRDATGVLVETDDEWLIESVDKNGIQLRNMRTGHYPRLHSDHVNHFTTAPQLPDQLMRGFLELTVRIELRGDNVIIEPILSGPARLAALTQR